MQSTNSNETDSFQCMEVRGGRGTAANFFERPGIDVWTWSQSHRDFRTEGGDIHYVSSCASGRITRMLIGDVGGVDNLFTDVAERMRDIMKRNVNVIAQTSAIRQMRGSLDSASESGGFASTLLSTFFAPLRSFTVCNAGHPPPLLYRSTTSDWHFLKSVNPRTLDDDDPSGNIHADECQTMKFTLDVGDMVLSYSNDLTECRWSDGRTMGLVGIQKLAKRLNQSSTNEKLLEDWISLIRAEHEDNLQGVDATVMLNKITKTGVSMRDNILAPFRLARRRVSDRTSL